MNAQTETPVKAVYWDKAKNGKVVCRLCPFHCKLPEGKIGICRAKQNIGGELIAITYGRTTSLIMDPIEKKPLYHFYPGASILSAGPNACNLSCSFCQNFQISQLDAPTSYISPEALARTAEEEGSLGVAYTYTEPLMWYEYILDAAREVKERGLKNVIVTSGHLDEEPFRNLLPLIDAVNIDVKSMSPEFYRKTCKGKLQPVLRNVKIAAEKIHVEITNLVIPGLNDSDNLFEQLAEFLADIDPMIPLHFSAYHPAYRMNAPRTPAQTLIRAREIALKKLKYVYIGNVHVPDADNTYCPFCGALLIKRDYTGEAVAVNSGACEKCGEKVNIIN